MIIGDTVKHINSNETFIIKKIHGDIATLISDKPIQLTKTLSTNKRICDIKYLIKIEQQGRLF